MKQLYFKPYYHHYYNHSNNHCNDHVPILLIFWTFFIILYIFYIIIICTKRTFNDYPKRKDFIIDLIIPFKFWILCFINLFKKNYNGNN
jgi:hypothetical protein